MFELATPTTVKLDHAKGRKEHHGDVKVLALDLSITWTTNNRALDMLRKGWREGLFVASPPDADPDEDQGNLDLRVSDLPFMRFIDIAYPLKSDIEYTGHTLRLDYGRGGDADKVVNLCKVHKFAITPIEGGSVQIHFALSSAADITGELVGVFSERIQQDITITLLAPAEVQDGIIDASAGSGAPGTGPAAEPEKTPKKQSKAQRDATEAFIAQHSPQAH